VNGPGAEVVLDVDLVDGAFYFVLANIGSTTVFDVRATFSRKLRGVGGRVVMTDLPIFAKLTMLRPGKEIAVFFDRREHVLAKTFRPFTVKVGWRTADKQQRTMTYRHDLEAYRGLPEIVTRER
jgi:hypothetical protein